MWWFYLKYSLNLIVYSWNICENENLLTHDRIIERGKKQNTTEFQRLNAFPENTPQELSHSRCLPCGSHCPVLRSVFFGLSDLFSEPGPACLQLARPRPETRPFQNLPSGIEGPAYSGCGQRFRGEEGSSSVAWTVDTGTWTHSFGSEETWLQWAAL